MRHNLTKQTITAPTIAIGFMGGVVLPILLTNAIATKKPNAIYRDDDKGELENLRHVLNNLDNRLTNIHYKITGDHISSIVSSNDEDYDFNDLLF